jgi:hypothetical protein
MRTNKNPQRTLREFDTPMVIHLTRQQREEAEQAALALARKDHKRIIPVPVNLGQHRPILYFEPFLGEDLRIQVRRID